MSKILVTAQNELLKVSRIEGFVLSKQGFPLSPDKTKRFWIQCLDADKTQLFHFTKEKLFSFKFGGKVHSKNYTESDTKTIEIISEQIRTKRYKLFVL